MKTVDQIETYETALRQKEEEVQILVPDWME